MSTKKILRQFAAYPLLKIEGAIISLLINILGLALPLALLQVYDRVIPNQGYATISLLVIGVASALIAEAIMRFARSFVMSIVGMRFDSRASTAAVDYLLCSDLEKFEQIGVGVHMERFNAINQLRDYYSGQSILTLIDLPFALLSLTMIYFISGPLVWAPACLLVFFLCASLLLATHLHSDTEELTRTEDHRSSFMISCVQGIHTVKGLALERRLGRSYIRLQEQRAKASLKVDLRSSLLVDFGASLTQLTTITLAGWGSMMVMQGTLTNGALSASILLAGRTMQPFQNLVSFWSRYQSMLTARKNLIQLFETQLERRHDATESTVSPTILSGEERLRGSIAIRNVTFRFPDSDTTLLENISLKIEPNEFIAITGSNGCGKSVLIKLIAGLHHPTSGEVLIDDLPATSYPEEILGKQIAYIPQREGLFRGTIMENISLFRDETRDGAAGVARALGLADAVSGLPNGYRTLVGDGAQEFLTRGMVQQISIVRALAAGPRIILFDEANSALDDAADRALKEFMAKVKNNATVILISQRPSLLRLGSRVFELTKGSLVPKYMDNPLTTAVRPPP
ncbi:putative hlyB (ABC transporter, ATP-binding protein) [Azospirillaceae bacterium]